MEVNTTTLILSIALAILLSSILLLVRHRPAKKRRPPGPWCLPFIGSLHKILSAQPQIVLRDLANKYGPVMYLQLGHVDAVVISSSVAAQEVLQDKNLNFASRPRIQAVEITCYGSTDIAFAPYGAYWRTLRKLCTVELLSARKVRQFAALRDNETLSLVANVHASCRDGEPFNLGKLLVSCTNQVTAKATFGQACDAELQEDFLAAIALGMRYSGGFCVGDLFPCLWFVDVLTGLNRRLWGARRQVDAVFDKIIAKCETRRQQKTGDEDDLLSVLLRIKDQGELEFPIGIRNIKAVIMDMFVAGTETTSSGAEWIMSELMRNPEAMAKAQEEVRRTFDNTSPQDHESHLPELRYTRMAVKEGLRLHPVVPLLLPRVCRETCNISGFEVAAGCRVMVNAWAIARSPDHWNDDAEDFRPERFEESLEPDYNGTQYDYLPFGSGRRICPGRNFGMAGIELIIARLLYYFNWSLPVGIRPDELDMDMIVSATAMRKNQLHLVATPRKVLPEF